MNIKIDKLVFGGQGLGRMENKAVFVWNALPGEEVEVEIKKNKGNFAEGIARRIIAASADRLVPQENHYLSCSPWQIISYDKENKWKVEIAEETYKKIGGFDHPNLEIVSDENDFGYRNKMEYSFVEHNNKISLAFFEREGKKHLPIDVCELARREINETARYILGWINKNKIPFRSLKAVIIRCNSKGEVLAGLFIKDRLEFFEYPELKFGLIGFSLYYSTHKSPASVPTEVLYKIGQDYLEENLLETKLRYGLFSFFQINNSIFNKALLDIKTLIGQGEAIVDYYSGVGSIGLPIANNFKECILVESNPEAIQYAEININLNKLTNCQAICQPSEKIVELITPGKTIIFDPPRAGLDKRVIEKVLVELPKLIVYMSCDLSTHARDIGLLREKYEVKFLKLYNFFPRTAHIEGLAVLQVKSS